MQVISRSEAKELGLKKYFTGTPCKNGHLSERRVCNCICLECKRDPSSREYMRQYNKKYKEDNSDRLKAEAAERYRQNRSKMLDRFAQRRAENLSKYRERERQYSIENKEAKREYHAKWRVLNKDKCRAIGSNYRARQKMADGICSSEEFAKIISSQKFRCANCRCDLIKSGHHRDHIMPLYLGGSNWPNNIQALCPSCNVRKNAKDPVDWARQNGRLL